jgi:hypothetical protein
MATGGTIRSETFTSVVGAMDVLKSHGIGVALSVQIGGYVAHNRNALVDIAQKNQSTHLMFIDNDMVFQPSAIQRLIDHDKDIVGANYNARGVPDKPIVSTVKMINPETDPNGGKDKVYSTTMPAQLFKCYGLGTGMLLVKMKVFNELEKPYFVAWEDANGEHHTEDIDFCRKAGEAGFDVWCSPTIKVEHIGTYFY